LRRAARRWRFRIQAGHGQGDRAGGGAAFSLFPMAVAPVSPACPEGRPGEREPGHVRGE
jgi:hypothetical protein